MRFLSACAAIVLLCVASPATAQRDKGKEPEYRGKALSAWAAELKSPDAKKRAEAAEMIGWLRERAVPAVGALIAALSDADAGVRRRSPKPSRTSGPPRPRQSLPSSH